MKILVFILGIYSIAVQADWGGNVNYPDTKCSQGKYTVYLNGVAQTTQYTQLHTVIPTAMLLSQKLQTGVVVRGSDIICSTTWRKISSSSSTASSVASSRTSSSAVSSLASSSNAPVTIVWTAPTERENGHPLPASEIGGYEIRYTVNNKLVYVDVENVMQAVISGYPKNGTMEIAAYDTQGLYSRYVKVVE